MTDRLALCYHALSDSWPAVLAVKPTRFEQQLSWLTERGYRGVTFSDLVMETRERVRREGRKEVRHGETIAVPDRAGYLLGRRRLSRGIRRRDDNGHVS